MVSWWHSDYFPYCLQDRFVVIQEPYLDFVLGQVINRLSDIIRSRRKNITVLLWMPKGILPEDINEAEPLVFIPGQVESKKQFVSPRGRRSRSCTRIKAIFDKNQCVEHLSQGMNSIEVVGKLNNCQCFYGSSRIYVFRPWGWMKKCMPIRRYK